MLELTAHTNVKANYKNVILRMLQRGYIIYFVSDMDDLVTQRIKIND